MALEGGANGKVGGCISNPTQRRESAAMSLRSFLKASPFQSGGDDHEDDEEEEAEEGGPRAKPQKGEEPSKTKVKTSALAVFAERLSQWESSGRRPLVAPNHPDLIQVYCTQNPDATGAKPTGFSPEKDPGRFPRMEMHNPSPPAQSASLREMLRGEGAASFPSGSREAKCSVVMDFLRDRMTR